MSARLTILSLSTIHQDGRVLRQIDFAARAGYDVTVVGWGHLDRNDRPNVTMRPVKKVMLPPASRIMQAARMLGGRITSRAFEQWYWAKPDHHQALQAVIAARSDLIHVNEAIGLPIAIEAAQRTGAKVLFDAHEYATEHRSDSLAWRLVARPFYEYIIRVYAARADAMITVSEPIARRYEEVFGIPQVEVIHNAPAYRSYTFRPTQPQHIKLIHHGAAASERRLELMIQALAQTSPRFTMDFMLLPVTPGYVESLQKEALRLAPDRITFISPVPPHAISGVIHNYDVGVFLLEPSTFNHAMALPNKLFEYIMAGLAVTISPTPAMKELVERYGLGVAAADYSPESLARAIDSLTPEMIDAMKRHSLEAAKELNAEHEMAKVLDIYHRILELHFSPSD